MNYKTLAEDALECAKNASNSISEERFTARANVYATMHLAEQQRIDNLITVAGWVMDSTAEDVGYDLDKLRVGTAGEVWDVLGLS